MKLSRLSGILLHPTSLPGRFGIGDLGAPARDFLEFLEQTRQGLWQVLPLGPTGYGDSPYQCFSAFAGNPLLVSLEALVEEGVLGRADLAATPAFGADTVDFGAVAAFKRPVLAKAHAAFRAEAKPGERRAFEAFCRKHAAWLDDFALFGALKEAHGGAAWVDWEASIARRKPAALGASAAKLADAVDRHRFVQYLFHRQWAALRAEAHRRHILLMGDVPIFVSYDSADVWGHPQLFRLDEKGRPSHVAGCPPDYFSEDGQLWGNPLYDWDALSKSGFRWWIERVRAALGLFDLVRLDHFRGFEACWEVPASHKTARHGKWVKVPGGALFDALGKALGPLPIVAENLGVITPAVEALREHCGFPGMAILQFAFGPDQDHEFRPHRFTQQLVAYTGTHDNDTVAGWWNAGTSDSTLSAEAIAAERSLARRYLATDGQQIHWDFIRAVLASVAALAIVPLQDVLGLGSEARMNLPGRPGGSWRWRFRADALTPELRARLGELTELYGRKPGPVAAGGRHPRH